MTFKMAKIGFKYAQSKIFIYAPLLYFKSLYLCLEIGIRSQNLLPSSSFDFLRQILNVIDASTQYFVTDLKF